MEPLIATFTAVKADPGAVHRAFDEWPVDRDTYYEVRSMVPRGQVERAAQFIYLNKTAWNGLYRVNRKGEFNVPFGRPKSSNIVPIHKLRDASVALAPARLTIGDFEATLESARAGDLVFVDPPYVTSHNDNGFVEYNEHLFSWDDQVRLANVCAELARKGVHLIVTNAAHDAVRALYSDLHATEFRRFSTLAGKPEKRRVVSELVFSTRRPERE